MAPKPRWIQPIAIAAALSLAGCSFRVSGPPAHTPSHEFPKCDEDIMLPTLDLAWASLYGLVGLAALADAGGDDEALGALASAAAGLALFGGAAIYGLGKARRCGEVRDEYRARYQQQLRREEAPSPFGPPSTLPPAPG